MHQAWLAFATHGDPGRPDYDEARTAMRFDTSSVLGKEPAPDETMPAISTRGPSDETST
jgi:para-nitrobenzyl esterase